MKTISISWLGHPMGWRDAKSEFGLYFEVRDRAPGQTSEIGTIISQIARSFCCWKMEIFVKNTGNLLCVLAYQKRQPFEKTNCTLDWLTAFNYFLMATTIWKRSKMLFCKGLIWSLKYLFCTYSFFLWNTKEQKNKAKLKKKQV